MVMNKDLSNKMNMFEALSKTCLAHQSVWAGNPKFVESFNLFTQHFTDLRSTMLEISQLDKLSNAAKTAKKAQLIDELMVVRGALYAEAKAINDNSLIDAMKNTRSRLIAMKEELLLAESTALILLFQANSAVITSYGITQEMIDHLPLIHSEFFMLHSKPRENEALIAAKNDSASEITGKMMKMLKDQFSGMMLLYKSSAPRFYKAYMVSRKIINLKGGGKPKNNIFPSPMRDDDSIS